MRILRADFDHRQWLSFHFHVGHTISDLLGPELTTSRATEVAAASSSRQLEAHVDSFLPVLFSCVTFVYC